MANSDNVLRAGLTPKFIDVPELLANRVPPAAGVRPANPAGQRGNAVLPDPGGGFRLLAARFDRRAAQRNAAIVFCVAGEATLENQGSA